LKLKHWLVFLLLGAIWSSSFMWIKIAAEIHRPRAYRAVGRANATNPMPIVIPCHRLIGVDGKLHGYGGGEGLKTKEWLLKMEGAVIA